MLGSLSPQGLISDVRHAARALRKDLGLVVFATLITGLGVGATTAVYSVMKPLLIEPLPFVDSDRLVWIANMGDGGLSSGMSRTGNLRDFRELSTSFDGLAGYFAFFESYTLTGSGEPERLEGVGVTDDFLRVLGVEPMLGRGFTPEEGEVLGSPAIILSHRLWERRFGGDENIVGQPLTINGSPSVVAGVLPPSFDFASIFSPGSRIDLLATFPVTDQTDAWGNTLSIIGRLAPDVALEGARAEMAVILEQLQSADPERWGLAAELIPLQQVLSGEHRTSLLLLFAASASVLLIVCVNLSSLLLSKGIRRRQEMFLRAALGAPRGRLLRLLMIESLLLAGCGALLGVGLARLITSAVASSSSVTIPLLSSVRVDSGALVFSCLVAIGAGLAVGILPAIQASGVGSAGELRAASRTLTSSRRSRWLREVFVVAEVAVACALLVVGALLIQSFTKLLAVDLGFQPEEVAAWPVDTERDFENYGERVAFFDALLEAVNAVPGVSSVGLVD
ncbi:MAG: ABC transporter permease, partial [Acidobacteriota bacterium]